MIQGLTSRYFFRGFGRALDLRGSGGRRYSPRREWHRSDGAAMASDWTAVFQDLAGAYERVKQRGRRDG
ncbi:hypothetical protein [Longimicrobium sp.]|uniref:hypothetical protein n=1 Tax=Longimicrobium sp. TaxID=2029185 RepID=UPI003B3AA61E